MNTAKDAGDEARRSRRGGRTPRVDGRGRPPRTRRAAITEGHRTRLASPPPESSPPPGRGQPGRDSAHG